MNAMKKFGNGYDTQAERFFLSPADTLVNVQATSFSFNQDTGVKNYSHGFLSGMDG